MLVSNDHKNYESPISLSDIVIKVLFVVFVLYILAALQSSLEKAKKESIEKKAEFAITMEWDQSRNPKLDCDVDLWIRTPAGNLVWWQNKEADLVNLERDDIGDRNDVLYNQDGTTTINNEDKEYVFIRGNIPGEYTVNAHLFGCFSNAVTKAMKLDEPLKVTFVLTKLNPSFQMIKTETIELSSIREEKTAFQFYLDANGNVLRTDRIPTYLIKQGMLNNQ